MPLIIVLLAAATAPAAAPPSKTEQELVALEKKSWAAWQKMDSAFWQRFLSDDHIEVNGYVGALGKEDVIRGIAGKVCTVSSYKVSDFKFRQIDTQTAVLIYKAEQDTTCGGVKVPSPVWATSVYSKRGGKWQNVVYEHTPALTAPAAKKAEPAN